MRFYIYLFLIVLVVALYIYMKRMYNSGVAIGLVRRTVACFVGIFAMNYLAEFAYFIRNLDVDIRDYIIISFIILIAGCLVLTVAPNSFHCDSKKTCEKLYNETLRVRKAELFICFTGAFLSILLAVTLYVGDMDELHIKYPYAEPTMQKYYNINELQTAMLKSLPAPIRDSYYYASNSAGELLIEKNKMEDDEYAEYVEETRSNIDYMYKRYEANVMIYFLTLFIGSVLIAEGFRTVERSVHMRSLSKRGLV